ncbi:MAG: hypothetical protein JJ863_23045 [Deltaproteobacteria bacterium]|nr:hypothetical protein [Deltaproteobacteria bacterium]
MSTLTNTHPARMKRAQASLQNAHAPIHQSSLPRLVLGAVALVPAASLIAALLTEGATRMALGYFNILWTGLLMLVFGGWMLKSGRFSLERKIAWVFSWILAAPLSLPLYWYRHVWHAPQGHVTHA